MSSRCKTPGIGREHMPFCPFCASLMRAGVPVEIVTIFGLVGLAHARCVPRDVAPAQPVVKEEQMNRLQIALAMLSDADRPKTFSAVYALARGPMKLQNYWRANGSRDFGIEFVRETGGAVSDFFSLAMGVRLVTLGLAHFSQEEQQIEMPGGKITEETRMTLTIAPDVARGLEQPP